MVKLLPLISALLSAMAWFNLRWQPRANEKAKTSGLVIGLLLLTPPAWAERPEFQIEIKDHLFFPAEITIPAGQKVKLVIYNGDTTPEQFDSFDLNREKVIFPNRKAVIYIGPLPEGRYDFFGEYNPNTARGTVVVKHLTPVKGGA